MREIKFRAWDKLNKIMHYDVSFIKSGDEGNDWILFISDKRPLNNKPSPLDDPFFSQQIKLMQYTGLKDKNGKEIWEGNVVQYENQIYQITYDIREACFCLLNMNDNFRIIFRMELEVIGNIYENPNLLKEANSANDKG